MLNFSVGNDLCSQQRFMNYIEFHNLCRGLMFICLVFWSYNLQQVVTSLNNVTSRRKTRWRVSTTADYVIHVFGFVLFRMYYINRNLLVTPSVTPPHWEVTQKFLLPRLDFEHSLPFSSILPYLEPAESTLCLYIIPLVSILTSSFHLC
jgi:hypothetical protein